MTLWATFMTALNSLRANRLRAFLALLGIVIGVCAVISLMSIGRGSQATITERIQNLGTNLLSISPQSGGVLTLEDAFALIDPIHTPSIKAVAPQISTFGTLIAGKKSSRTQIIGTTPEALSVRSFTMKSGIFISIPHVTDHQEVVVLGSQVATDLFGDRDSVGEYIRINSKRYTIIGILAPEGGTSFGSVDRQVMVPITTAYYRILGDKTVHGDIPIQSINVEAHNHTLMEKASEEIQVLLRLRHKISDEDDFVILNLSDVIETLEETTQTFVIFLGTIAGISLLVGGIGIMNIMLVSVTERTREIGIRKAMGATKQDILLQFVTESVILSFGGGMIGIIFGIGISQLVNGMNLGNQMLRTVVSYDIALLALLVSSAIGLFFGIYPAIRASALHPIDALRYE